VAADQQPTSIAVIVNAAAGGKSHDEAEVRDLFHAAGREARIITLRPGQSPFDAARAASAHASIVVAAGGDGTVSAVAAGILESPAALGVLPLGTMNHFAKDLRIPLGLPDAAGVIAAGHVRRVDVGRVNDRVFVNNASIGVYPDIVQERETLQRHGHAKLTAMVIATLSVLKRYPGLTVTADIDGQVRTWRSPFVFVGNNEYDIDGLHIGARTRLDRGVLFVYLSPRTRTRDLPLLLARALIGRAGESGGFEIVPAANLTIAPAWTRRIPVALDGEVAAMSTPLRYRACPAALRVVAPQP
jgi:diacylglycerol kinase family enzyme